MFSMVNEESARLIESIQQFHKDHSCFAISLSLGAVYQIKCLLNGKSVETKLHDAVWRHVYIYSGASTEVILPSNK